MDAALAYLRAVPPCLRASVRPCVRGCARHLHVPVRSRGGRPPKTRVLSQDPHALTPKRSPALAPACQVPAPPRAQETGIPRGRPQRGLLGLYPLDPRPLPEGWPRRPAPKICTPHRMPSARQTARRAERGGACDADVRARARRPHGVAPALSARGSMRCLPRLRVRTLVLSRRVRRPR